VVLGDSQWGKPWGNHGKNNGNYGFSTDFLVLVVVVVVAAVVVAAAAVVVAMIIQKKREGRWCS